MSEWNKNKAQEMEEGEEIDLIEIFTYGLSFWPWFVGSVVICIAVACLYLHYTPPVYSISATAMIKDEKKGGNTVSELTAFENIGLPSANSCFDNEVEVIKSRSLLKHVVYEMKTYVTYTIKDGLSTRDLYGDSPIMIEMSAQENDLLEETVTLELSLNKDLVLTVSGMYGKEEPFSGELISFPSILESPGGKLIFSLVPGRPFIEKQAVHATIRPSIEVAKEWLKKLDITPTSKTTSVARIAFKDNNKKRGEDFLNKLIEVHNRFTNSDKNLVGLKTEQFINGRISIISGELGTTEKELESFKSRSGLTNLDQVSSGYLKENAEYQQKMIENSTQISLITSLKNYIDDPANKGSVIPVNIGLTDNMLAASTNTYNEQIMERERLMRVSASSNPVILRMNASLDGMLANVKGSIQSVLEGLRIMQRDLRIQAGKFSNLISTAPTQERILTNITRQQEIKSGLYLMLLQKREENSIAMAATVDNVKIIDAAMADDAPVAPKRMIILLAATILGIMIPASILFLRNLLRYKIGIGEEVKKITSAPVLNDIPLSPLHTPIVVRANENTLMTEVFRDLRTNLQFMLGDAQKKIIMITSTRPEEGKTFVAANTAISLALLNKKVLLIGLDIRKPRLAECFNVEKNKEGITAYLSGRTTVLSSLIIPSGAAPSLDLLPAGQIPPNPAELLAGPKLEEVIQEASGMYDYIVIDTAPIGVVTDTLILGRVANLTLYVCRSAFTHKKEIGSADALYKGKKLNNMCMLVNGVKWETKRYGHYGNQYAYGYGQYGYSDEGLKKQKK